MMLNPTFYVIPNNKNKKFCRLVILFNSTYGEYVGCTCTIVQPMKNKSRSDEDYQVEIRER